MRLEVVLGGSGCIGSNLITELMKAERTKVLLIDRLEPRIGNIQSLDFLNADLVLEREPILDHISNFQKDFETKRVWHLAANSDIQKGTSSPFVDFKDTLGTTVSALEIAEKVGADDFIFASSSAVYGDHKGKSVSETEEALVPISNYGKMKLWSEELVISEVARLGFKSAHIIRFPNVIGKPLTHGVIKDFYEKLKSRPSTLEVLGNGRQRKQYMHVKELVRVILLLVKTKSGPINVFNVAPDDLGIQVSEIAEEMVTAFSPLTKIVYGKTPYGWLGDVPVYHLNTSKIQSLGIKVLQNSKDALREILEDLKNA